MTELRLTKEIMDEMIIKCGKIPLDFEVTSYDQQVHFIDKDGYKYNYSWSQLKHRANRNLIKIGYSNIYSIENIKHYMKLNNIEVELLSEEFKNVTELLKFKCVGCGEPFNCSWNKLKARKYYLCDKCLETTAGVYKDRKNLDEVEKAYNNIGLYLYNRNEYCGSNKNIDCYDKYGYKYKMRYTNVFMGKVPNIAHKTNPYSVENINNYLKINNSNTVCTSKEYKSEKETLFFICGECSNTFKRTWANMNGATHLYCEKCQITKRGENRRICLDEVIQGFNKMNLNLLDFNYTGNSKRLLCEDMFGYRGYVSYNSQLKIANSSRTGFDYFSLKHNYTNFIYNANNFCKLNDYDCEVLSIEKDIKYTTPTIKCKCNCGKEYITSISSFKSGKMSCDECAKSISRYELATIKYLDKNKIEYTRQKRFKDCKNILPLPFDFYIKNKNMLIEIDGQGHYNICHFNRCSKEQGEKSFEITKINDKIKDLYCKEKGINLIRIPYWDMDNENYVKILNQSILNLAD